MLGDQVADSLRDRDGVPCFRQARVRELAGVPYVDSVRRKSRSVAHSLLQACIGAANQLHEPVHIMGLGKLHLMPDQHGLDVLLGGLLSMVGRSRRQIRLIDQVAGCGQVLSRLREPTADELTLDVLRRLDR